MAHFAEIKQSNNEVVRVLVFSNEDIDAHGGDLSTEAEQWVANIARHSKLDYCIASKQRFGDKEVEVTIPDADYFQRHIILVDDVASTGKTLLAVAQKLAKYQPASISVLVTHALFVNDAQEELIAANVSNIWSCDSIPHPSNAIQLANLLAGELIKMIELD